MTLAALDQQVFTAVTSYPAHGCGGLGDPDSVDGESTFVVAGDAADRLEVLEGTWQQLWHSPGREVSDATRGALAQLGLDLPADPGPAPVWDHSWAGTHGELQQALAVWREGRQEFDAELTAVLARARVQLLTDAGAVPVSAWIPSGLQLVHDFGCRCGHGQDTDGDGRTVLAVRGDRVYVAPVGTDLDGLLAQSEEVRGARFAEVEAANRDHLTKLLAEGDVTLRPADGASVSDMTYPQWVAWRDQRVEEAREVFARAQAAGDWETLRTLSPRLRRGILSPAYAADQAARRVLEVADVRALGTEEVTELAAALRSLEG